MWYLRDKMSVKQPVPTTRRLSAALAESASSANTGSSSSHIFMSPERQDWAYYHSTPSSRMSSPVSSRRGSLNHIHQQYDFLSNRRASLTTTTTKFENYTQTPFISSGTDKIRAKREPSLCNESVNGHFWSNLCLNCILYPDLSKLTFGQLSTGPGFDSRSRQHWLFFFFLQCFSLFWLGSPSVPLEFPKLANAQPSNFGPLHIFECKR